MNGLDTQAGLADLHALLASPAVPDFLVLPKTDSAAHLWILDRLLTSAGRATRLVGIIESAQALSAVEEIASATPRLAALVFGAADMAADLGAEVAWEPLLHARSRLVAACARSGRRCAVLRHPRR
jgi:(S)-citramalyl-CoA lyase